MKRFEFQINCSRVVVTQNRRVGNIDYDLITLVSVIWQNIFYNKETNSAIFFLNSANVYQTPFPLYATQLTIFII